MPLSAGTLSPPVGAPAFAVEVFGELRIAGPGAAPVGIRAKKLRALAGFLCLQADGAAPRDALADLLWSDRGPEQARASFRQALQELRRLGAAEGGAMFVVSRSHVALDPAQVASDVRAFRAIESAPDDPGAADACMALWRGALLAQLDGLDPAFDAWLRTERTAWEQRFVDLLDAMAAAAEKRGDAALTRSLAQKMLAIDASRESAHRSLMMADLHDGAPASALRRFEALRRYLADEFQTHPAAQTRALAEAIRAGDLAAAARAAGAPPVRLAPAPQPAAPAPPPAAAGPEHARPTLVVLPFRNVSADPEADYVCEGLADELTLALSRMREFRVLSRRTGATLAADPGSFEEAARRHGIDYTVSASVWKVGGTLRVNVGISHSRTNTLIWGERLDYQDFSASAFEYVLARILGAVMPSVERDFMTRPRAADDAAHREAYDLYLKGKHLIFHGLTVETAPECKALLERAVALNPDLSVAYHHLVRIYNTDTLETTAGGDLSVQRERALRFARKGLELDPSDPHAYISVGWCHLWRREFREARLHFERAVALRPYDADRLTDLATGMSMLGDQDAAEDLMKRAMEMNPLYPQIYLMDLAEIRLFKRDFDSARALMRMLSFRNPRRLLFETATLGHLGETDEARRVGEELVDSVAAIWMGDPAAGPAEFVDWAIRMRAFARAEEEGVLREGVRLAGLPA
jgi:DNA-binding SARP family transcriptional activator/TolB-like protein/Tfp pilus assembly protein PilF